MISSLCVQIDKKEKDRRPMTTTAGSDHAGACDEGECEGRSKAATMAFDDGFRWQLPYGSSSVMIQFQLQPR